MTPPWDSGLQGTDNKSIRAPHSLQRQKDIVRVTRRSGEGRRGQAGGPPTLGYDWAAEEAEQCLIRNNPEGLLRPRGRMLARPLPG